jgi:regulator of protease activity HflC (stomatin/prohibitin superfamily)
MGFYGFEVMSEQPKVNPIQEEAKKTSISEEAKKNKKGLRKYLWQRRFSFLLWFMLLAAVVVFLWQRIFISIYPGELGVLWKRFGGTVLEKTYGEGLNIILPINKMYVYDVRVIELHNEIFVLSKDGMQVNIKVSSRYQIIQDKLTELHQQVGPDYQEKIIRPEIITAVRRVFGKYSLEEIYSKDEKGLLSELSSVIEQNLNTAFPRRQQYIHYEKTIILQLSFPPSVQEAINSKLVEEQHMLTYKFSKLKAMQEKERKVLEAEGISEFEKISKIPILQWKGIEATIELAKSPNSKIIIMGTQSKELPVILNAETNTK